MPRQTRLVPLILVSALLLPACSSTPKQDAAETSGQDVFGRPVGTNATGWGGSAAGNDVRVSSAAGPNAWTIVLAAADAADPAQADRLLQQVQTVGRLPDAFIMDRGTKRIIAVGSYRNPADPLVKVELSRVQSIVVDGARPYEHAFLAPPSGELSKGTIPEYDLRNAKGEYGKQAVYTLQIAAYGREDGTTPTAEEQSQIRAAAEAAAVALRQAGELAFYYHGPIRSMVTVGIYSEEDHQVDEGFTIESPRLIAARKRHPLNLLNGRTILERTRGSSTPREQASFLVAVPSS